jgi:hypothetical protein
MTTEQMGFSFRGTIQSRFEAFHKRNPFVYDKFCELARRWIGRRGKEKLGMKMLFEVVRWEVYMTTDDPASEFKLCNDYHSRYARLIMAQEPDLHGIFELRRLRRI